MNFHDSRWAKEIISGQNADGSWGYFHTLSYPAKAGPITTEQALRRLRILGLTKDELPIKRALSYMHQCLTGEKQTPDRREKLHNWDAFTALILSTWIRRFTLDDDSANEVAHKWAEIIRGAFITGSYDHEKYMDAFGQVLGFTPRGGRFVDFVSFYQVSIISDILDDKTGQSVFDYILKHASGIYYIYGKPLSVLPDKFASKQASGFIAAIELLSEYKNPECRNKLKFVVDWLNKNKGSDGLWDMGPAAKDGVYFPLSDSWRSIESRKQDCTYRLTKLIDNIIG